MDLRLAMDDLRLRNKLKACIQFSRPHTVIGTTVSAVGLYLMALAGASGGQWHLEALGWALLSCLGANIYIVGLNQLTDVEIDRINKPGLPLASGIFSMRTGWMICLVSLLLSVAVAASQGYFLLITVIASLVIGTAYSAPPLRLKRFHFWAAACIFTVRGVVVNLFLFRHFNLILNGSSEIPFKIWLLTAFIFGLSLVIAWFKDIPDIDGDRRFEIMTLSIKFGQKTVFKIGLILLSALYVGLIFAGMLDIPGVNSPALIFSHLFLMAVMLAVGTQVNPEQKSSFSKYYLFTWGLFYSEYVVFAACCFFAIGN